MSVFSIVSLTGFNFLCNLIQWKTLQEARLQCPSAQSPHNLIALFLVMMLYLRHSLFPPMTYNSMDHIQTHRYPKVSCWVFVLLFLVMREIPESEIDILERYALRFSLQGLVRSPFIGLATASVCKVTEVAYFLWQDDAGGKGICCHAWGHQLNPWNWQRQCTYNWRVFSLYG